MKFSFKDIFPADLVTFTEESLNGKLHFLCSDGLDIARQSLWVTSDPMVVKRLKQINLIER